MSISWGKRQRFKFTGGEGITAWSPPMISAVYAITYRQDPNNRPKSHTVLYFGQGEDLSRQAPAFNNDVLDFWIANGGQASELFVFIHPLPGSTRWQRSSVHEQLISEYYPECNRY